MNNPWLVAAFDGWNDASDAATGVVDHLVDHLDVSLLTEFDPEEFYSFVDLRPHVLATGRGDRIIEWPTPTIYHAPGAVNGRDLLLVRAPEPHLKWKTFCAMILDVAEQAGVTEMITLGALLADTPHTRPVPVTGSTDDEAMSERLSLAASGYSGPIGITTVLGDMAMERNIASASLWAAVPHYLADPPCPKATLALLGALEDAMDTTFPQGVLGELSEAWQRGAEDLMRMDRDIAEYVDALESERDEQELPEASGDAIAREFERFLRRRDTDEQ
jgi:proteasome assembly chaperone (PAC2) family protein